MKDARFVYSGAAGIAPYLAELRQLEQSIQYPIGNGVDHFVIDHGPEYHPFFSGLGDARFLLAVRGSRVLGSIAGVMRTVTLAGQHVRALYLCDLKVAPDARGQHLSRSLLLRGLTIIARDPALRQTRFFYGAAMRGSTGDVMRSVHGAHPFKLSRPAAQLHVYFAAPAALAKLDVAPAPTPPRTSGLILGQSEPLRESTAGRKDLRLVSTGQPWPLVHLPLSPIAAGWAQYLRETGASLLQARPVVSACFAVDQRLTNHVAWLETQGIAPGAVCTVYSWRLALRPTRSAWVHLPTSEI
jgi:hypothetical protein